LPRPSSVSSDSQESVQLKQVQSLVKFVQTLLPPDARTAFQQEQEQHQSKQHQQGSQQNQDQDEDEYEDQDHHNSSY